MLRRFQESWGEGRVFRVLPKLYGWRSPCIGSRGKEKIFTGFSNSTNTAFAEIMLHSCRMKTERTLIYHTISVATGLLQNNAYGHERVVFCLIIPFVHCLLMFFFSFFSYKKCRWLFWFCVHGHRSMRSTARSIDRTVVDPCTRIDCKVRSWVVFSCNI